MDIQEKETNTIGQNSDGKEKPGKSKKSMIYAIAMVACLLLTIDAVRELYSIFSQWNNDSTLPGTLYIIRKVIAMFGWGALTWYTTDKYFKKNGR